MSTTTDDVDVKTETKVWECLVAAKMPDWFRGGGDGGARGGASESSSIASVASEKSGQARTSTSTTMNDAAVDTETKVWGCLVAARAAGLVQRRRRRRKGGAVAAERIARDFVGSLRWMELSLLVGLFSFQVVVAVD